MCRRSTPSAPASSCSLRRPTAIGSSWTVAASSQRTDVWRSRAASTTSRSADGASRAQSTSRVIVRPNSTHSVALILALGTSAHARPLESRSIEFRRADPQSIVIGTTFGPLSTHDGGATWSWYCPNAVGYGGMYNPDYTYAASGALFATTFNG